MLDSETKRRIDNARDILVGKVPDPKSQVEQITIALIYKFMDDMDAEAEELGGKRKFFTAEFARFGWAKLMSPSLGGHELIGLYGEGISSMLQNPGIPALFRDIFKNAYLPYRDPETLKSFLKVIDGFSYDHSERLGDAFEYLLSVLGSQGDAGQFRTPRHIIDFMVEVLNPQKNESILDPACGTAGFLISAWKHILAQNTAKSVENHNKNNSTSGNEYAGYKGNLLTPDERARLAANIKGYDISPDMVRLSLVNLYLHGFSDPHIVEYDTLTQDDKWNEVADVILANPPFMSPKGGIKPHKRFSVQATRSEVLFVDYMAEHLTATGRAAIVVPEGIIFQSGTAYKTLRKMLVDTSLVAVVSLPAGVFNPYSGVKTSILILDKRVYKQTDKVLFVKVQNDGFNLGAQRRAVVNSDLPEATRLLRSWMTSPQAFEGDGAMAQAVERGRIGESGDFNLSGERYRIQSTSNSTHKLVLLGNVCEVVAGQSPEGEYYNEIGDGMPFYQGKTEFSKTHIGAPTKWTTKVTKVAYANDILMSVRAPVGPVNFATQECCIGRGLAAIRTTDDSVASTLYVFNVLKAIEDRICGNAGATFASINKKEIEEIEIPLPPLEIQHQIVAEIEGYQKIIDGARQVLDNYKPHIAIHPDWSLAELGDICKPEYGYTTSALDTGEYRFIRITDIDADGKLKSTDAKFIDGSPEAERSLLTKGDILVARTGATFGKTMLFSEDYPAIYASYLIRLSLPKDKVLPAYYWAFAQSENYWQQANALMTGGGQPQFNGNALVKVRIPLPDLETQRAIVDEIEAEQALVAANRELIRRMEAKVKAAIDRVWGG
jgi:type I restriction enzyme M protein